MNLCDECGLHPANIYLTQIIDNESQSFRLCEECARKRGIHISIGEEMLRDDAPVPESESEVKNVECSFCHMKLSEFKNKGWLGCSACYQAFEKEIEDLLLNVHGSSEHKGKHYCHGIVHGSTDSEIIQLRIELDAAIKNEDFERAAMLRDAIYHLKSPKKQ